MANIILDLADRIKAINPDAEFVIDGDDYDNLVMLNGHPKPTLSEIEAVDVQKAIYSRLRAAEYPPIGDQLDALFHAGVFPADMAAQIQAVKDKYPKG